jgi:esterase/lipase superfamily enzyme
MELIRTSNADQNGSRVLVYIHGFNTTFEEAILRAAQFAFDLEFPSSVVVYSWPSFDNVTSYGLRSMHRSLVAGAGFRSLLLDLAGEQYVHDITVIGHSMGGEMTWREVAQLSKKASVVKKLINVILAAPDMGEEKFRMAASEIMRVGIPSTVYTSKMDKALQISRDVNNNLRNVHEGRAGLFVPLSGMDNY